MKKYMTTTACSLLLMTALFFSTFTANVFAASAVAASTKTTTIATSPTAWQSVCGTSSTGYARCLAMVGTLKGSTKPVSVTTPLATAPGGSAPYDPAELHTAYNLPTTASGTPTVAIVDAYNDPNAASDLATYRSHWGLSTCTTASGCLKIVNQTGGTSLPSGNASWAEEISLDLDMVSAICENCNILLVEATSASIANLGTAAKEAHTLGAIAISNSYGATESGLGSSESSYCSSYYQFTYTAVVASTGDAGPIVEYPSSCPYTTGAGGTSLSSTGTETAWNTSSSEGAGGGCSSYISIPSWQSSSVTGCSRRATGDVSADADPATGVYVYDSYGVTAGWYKFGGTSVASPIIASVFALAGNVSTTQYPASLPWTNYTSGCLNTVGGKTYAYQTGLGSPDGTSCF